MIRSHGACQLIFCALLLLVSLSSSGESQPRGNTPDEGRMDSQRVLLLEAVKTAILSSLGMDREPKPPQRASQRDLRKMFELYREKLREERRNSTQPWKSSMTAVLFSSTGEIFVWQADTKALLAIVTVDSCEKPFWSLSLSWNFLWLVEENLQHEFTFARAVKKTTNNFCLYRLCTR